MTSTWKNKYGTWRVRKDPPTLNEAVAAAQGLTDDLAGQIEIAASLMNVSPEEARSAVMKARGATTIVAKPTFGSRPGAAPAARSVVVERKPSRRPAIGRGLR